MRAYNLKEYTLIGVIVILVFVILNMRDTIKNNTISEEQRESLLLIDSYNDSIIKLNKERKILSMRIDSLYLKIKHINNNTPIIVNKIEDNVKNTNKEIDRVKLLPPNERDIWWKNTFTAKDSITWGRIDSLQY